MAKNYSKISGAATRNVSTPQMEKANDRQVQNNAGGYVYSVDHMEQLRRFLILGSDKGTYYVSGNKLSQENAQNIIELLKTEASGIKAVDEIVKISDEGRAPKNDPAIFAMALAASSPSEKVRSYALQNLHKVCRISTHLFTFVTYVDSMRGWGRGLRKAIANWYTEKTPSQVAYQVCKYPQRRVEGELPWSHRDLLRKVHLRASGDLDKIAKYIVKGVESFSSSELASFRHNDDLKYIWAHEQAKKVSSSKDIIPLIEDYGITRESIPNNLFDKKVWRAMLEKGMPMTAMIRNLRNMTKAEVLKPMSDEVDIIVNTLNNDELLHKSRIHPLNVLAALVAYAPDKFGRPSTAWGYSETFNETADYNAVPQVVDALEQAFYKSFKNVKPTGKKIMLAVDVSGSMRASMPTMSTMSCCMGAAAMSMVFARTEPKYYIHGFSGQFKDLGITSKDSLTSAMKKAQDNNFGTTDAAIPARYALEKRLDVDAFIILSDMETWAGNIQVDQAMNQYRSKMNKPNAKMICVGMVPSSYSLSDPKDKNGLNVVGFDTSTPQIIADFMMNFS